jgi:IS605 OrfB family transposase
LRSNAEVPAQSLGSTSKLFRKSAANLHKHATRHAGRRDSAPVSARSALSAGFPSKPKGGRPLPANAKGGAFVEDALGRWYVCFHVEIEARQGGNAEVGIDLGLKSLAALSDGRKIEAPQIYRRHEERLAIAQRARNKQRVRRIHANIKNCRRDFLHKVTTQLAREHALIAVGNVSSKQLAKTRMAKSVLDAGWSTFRAMLKYKSAGYVEVDERFTTVTCSACEARGGPQGQKGLRVRGWTCPACGASHDRDVNSALNIIAIARRSAAPPIEGSRRIAA